MSRKDQPDLINPITGLAHRAKPGGGYETLEEVRAHVDPIPALPPCDMEKDCPAPVAYIDRSGYVYCTKHGRERQSYEPCRKLRPFEVNRLRRGEQVEKY